MARKRLSPAAPYEIGTPPADPASPVPEGAPETKARFGLARTHVRPPIARQAAESAAESALAELSSELRAARAEGRMVQALPLDAVDAAHLLRDRLEPGAEDADMAALKASLAARGQQTPIEVVDRGEGVEPRYGLISGWRRLSALAALHAETGEPRFATVKALLRRPETAADAYQAMVEENEIRAGLCYWERARVVARAADQGVFDSERAALGALFAHASRPRRSKIGTFLGLFRALDGVLRHPAALPERRGLALAQALTADPALADRLAAALNTVDHADAEAEQAAIDALLAETSPRSARGEDPAPAASETTPPTDQGSAVTITRRGGRIVLSGPGIDDTLLADLRAWLAARP